MKSKLDNWENFDAKLNSLMQNNQLHYDKENLDGNYQNLEQFIEKLKQNFDDFQTKIEEMKSKLDNWEKTDN